MIEIVTPATRQDWLDLRRQFVGASEVACLLGHHSYLTPLELWSRKTGRAPDAAATPAMRRGQRLESVALDILKEDKPAWTIAPNPIPGGVVYCDREHHLACTPDALAQCARGSGVIQVKSVHERVFRTAWRGEAGAIELPLPVAIQISQEAMLTGVQWACCAAMVVDQGIDVFVIDVPINMPSVQALIHERVAWFWDYVERDVPPPADYGRDLATIKAINLTREPEPEAIDLSGDNEMLDALQTYADTGEEMSKALERRQVAEALIRARMEGHGLATAGDWLVRHTLTKRKAYEVKESSFHKLTIRQNKEAVQ
jgi:predicted phage-related endonuclease